MKTDIYERVTNKIIADLEQGELTWLKPWSAGSIEGKITKPLRHNGVPYSGINILMLWGASIEAGYLSPYWMTFKQAKELGAHVKKGERGNLVVYANTITKTEEQDDGSEEERKISFMKGYSVFNVEQIEGLAEHYYTKPKAIIDPARRIQHAEEFFASTGAEIRHGGNSAHYSGGSDHVQMPYFETFRSPQAYYATLAHELTHWTKHPKRLDREFGRKRWGDEAMRAKSLSPNLVQHFCALILNLRRNRAPIMRPTFRAGSRFCKTTSARSSAPPRMRSVPPISCTGFSLSSKK